VPQIDLDASVVAEVCQRHSIRELALFGSVTRDDFRPDSDVDILVEFDPDARVDLFRFIDIKDEFTTLFGREVDLVVKKCLDPFIREEVLANREVLYVSPQ